MKNYIGVDYALNEMMNVKIVMREYVICICFMYEASCGKYIKGLQKPEHGRLKL